MRNKLKFALMALFVAAIFAGPAMSATINESAALNGYTPFNIAYEIYNNALGINADRVPVFIANTAVITNQESKNLRVFNGKVNLSGQNVFLQADGVFIAAMVGAVQQAATVEPCATALVDGTMYAVGESIAGAVPSENISINIYDIATFCTRNGLGAPLAPADGFRIIASPTSYISTALGHVDATTFAAVINLPNALNFNVDPNLNPTCTYRPTVQLAYISQNETSIQTNILIITPQFTGSTTSTALNAELNTDFDFTQFISGNLFYNPVTLDGTVFTINNLQYNAPARWKAWVAETNSGSVAFTLNSINPQPGLDVYVYDEGTGSDYCTANGAATQWSCSFTDEIQYFTTEPGFTNLQLMNNPPVEMNPTIWTISNATINISGGTIQTACFAPAGPVGVWFGGLEVLVPFVKGDAANGYETYIKLFNRYTKDAKLYVATFKDGINGPMIISTTQIPGKEVIPMQSATNPNGMLQIESADIAAICPTCNMATGIPVKFLVRVPSQMGFTNTEGGIWRADDDDDYDFLYEGAQFHTNQFDPYVEGIVVSTSPNGQRSIPVEFKSFKNGEYNQ